MKTNDTPRQLLPTTHAIAQAFHDEVAALGGTVRSAHDDGHRLFMRAVLSSTTVVRPSDRVQGGVALRTSGPDVVINPYTFRLVCANGAIRAHALGATRLSRVAVEPVIVSAAGYESSAFLATLGEAIRTCASPETFAEGVEEMRAAAASQATELLNVMSLIDGLEGTIHASMVREILAQFDAHPDPDRSAYGLMNAFTAAARRARDPEVQWRLEEVGAAVPAWPGLVQRAAVARTAARFASGGVSL